MITYRVTWWSTADSMDTGYRTTIVQVAPDWEPSPTTADDIPRILAVNVLGDQRLEGTIRIKRLDLLPPED